MAMTTAEHVSYEANNNDSEPIAELRGVTVVGDGGATILRGVDLSVDPGERVLIHGPSGSGKSTIVRTLTAIEERPQVVEGSAYIAGRDIYDMSDNERRAHLAGRVALVFQTPELDDKFTVRDNLHNHHNLIMNERPSLMRLSVLATAFGIDEYMGRRGETLSGGQKLRVAIVRALLAPSELVVMDEPTHMLDVSSKRLVYGLMREVAKEDGSTMIVVSHDPEARDIATREVSVNSGAIE